MNFLYVADIRLPTENAHGAQIMKTCEALAATGVRLELVVPARKNPIAGDPFEYYGAMRNFIVTTLPVPDLVRFGSLGYVLSQLWFSERVRWLQSFWSADVIYSRDAGLLLQYVLLGRTLVYEAHAKPSFIARFVARRARKVVVISKGLESVYEAAGVDPQHILVAPDAIDLTSFAHPQSRDESRARLGLPQESVVAMYAGRIDGWKGVDTLLEASKNFGPVQLAVIGGNSVAVAPAAQAYPSVHFLGYQPYRELADNLAAADVVVLPNTGRDETSARFTSPLKLFAYMAAGKPIVASDLPSIREVLGEDEAYFFTPDDPVSLAAQVRLAVADKAAAAQKARAAQEAIRRYTWQARAAAILKFLASEVRSKNTFLIIQGAKLGDMVCTTPLFRAIKNNFPDSRLYVAGDAINKEVLEGNPHVDNYLYLRDLKAEDIRAKKIDVALLLNPNPAVLLELIKARIKKIIVPKVVGGFSPLMTKRYRLLSLLAMVVPHRMGHYAPGEYLRMLGPLGISVRDTTKELFYSDKARTTIEVFLKTHGLNTKQFAVISPSAGNKIKNWPADRFACVAEALAARGMPVVVIGGPRDAKEVADMINSVKHPKDIIDASGEFSIDELKAFIAQAGLFISVDTGPIYIAEAFKVPTVDITGPIDEREQPPIGPVNKVVVPPARRGPQLHVMNARIYDEAEVRRQLDSISVEMVLKTIDELLVV